MFDIGSLFKPVSDIVNKVVTSDKERLELQNQLAKIQADSEAKVLDFEKELALAQTKINEIEAANPSIFISGWRPFVGWVCALGCAWAFLASPILNWLLIVTGTITTLPKVDNEMLYPMLSGLLGFGGMRVYEKVKGVARI